VVLKDNSTGEFYSIAVTNFSKLILEPNDPFRKNTQRLFQREFLPEDLKIATVVWYHQMQITQEIFRNATLLMEITAAHILFLTSKVKTTTKNRTRSYNE
jgi:hypothetical protein